MTAPESAIHDVLASLRRDRRFADNVADWHVSPARPAEFAPIPAAVAPELVSVLAARGIDRLYSHQAEAVAASLAGENVVVVTPTASGKTLCYNLPVLQRVLDDPESRALYLFPTKALAHDQYAGLYETCKALGRDVKVFTYDGDTPGPARKSIHSAGQIVVTNPDMLHSGILPFHTKWVRLFENLRTIVIDEMHQYRGVFGSHVANVIRRLRRICAHYGAKPRFVCCSATIANPRELAERLVEEHFRLVDRDGSPRGERVTVFYNPPVVNAELGIRASAVKQARRIAMRFVERDIQTIVFGRSRNQVEILANYMKREMRALRRDPNRIRAYRGGYLPNLRREIEAGIRSGEVVGVVSTNALELGIDIGSLQVAVLTGYPGTIASTRQQGGRAGRHAQTAVVVLVGTSAPLDQFFMSRPDFFFEASPENAVLNPDNVAVLASHLKCALYEIPFGGDETFGSRRPEALLDFFESEGIARRVEDRVFWSSSAYPAEEVSLRTATPQNFVLHDTTDGNKVLAEVDFDSAREMIHEQAIYLHEGRTFHVDKLDWDRRRAYVRRIAADYYTEAIVKGDLFVLAVDEREDFPEREPFQPLRSRSFGVVKVATTVPKFKKIKFETHESVGYGEIALPEIELQTEAAWWTFRPETAERLAERGCELAGALKGLSWVFHTVAAVHVMSDPRDFATVPMVRSPFDELPTLYLHDRVPGGIGLARRAFGLDRQILRGALDLVRGCRCEKGCPSCVGPAFEAGGKAKAGAAILVEAALGATQS